MARDAHAITLYAFAQDYEPLPELPALPPAAVPLAPPSMVTAPVVPGGTVPEGLDDGTNDSVSRWLTSSALPLVLAADEGGKSIGNMITGVGTVMGDDGEIVRGESEVPVVSTDGGVLPVAPVKSPKGKRSGNGGAETKRTAPKNSAPRKRSPKGQALS